MVSHCVYIRITNARIPMSAGPDCGRSVQSPQGHPWSDSSNFLQNYICVGVWFQMMQFCCCVYSTPVSCDGSLKKVFVQMFPFIFFRPDHAVLALLAVLTMSLLFEICLPVGILLIPKELKHWETGFEICYLTTIWCLPNMGNHNSKPRVTR
jgi:hypothetical protein